MAKTVLEQAIEDRAAKVASSTIDGTTVQQRPLTELIEADRHLSGAEALKKPRFGMQTRKMRRGGALG